QDRLRSGKTPAAAVKPRRAPGSPGHATTRHPLQTAGEAPRLPRPSQKSCGSSAVVLFPIDRAGEENESELPDLDLVTVGQDRGVHRFPVHISAVETADVDHHEVIAFAPELGVPTRNSDIVE